MSRESLSPVDLAWLRMEEPNNLMMITGIMILNERMDWKRFRATFEHRLVAHFERFRQRVVMFKQPLGAAYWEDDPNFDLDFHLQRAALPKPANQAALQAAVSELMSTPLDFSRPLWQIHFIERFGHGSAMIVRLHHCIADGIALVRVLLSLTDTSADAPWPTAPGQATLKRASRGKLAQPSHTTQQLAQTIVREGKQALDDPERLTELARAGSASAVALGRLVLRWPDPKTIFKGELGIAKRAVWSKPIALQEVKAIGRTMGATVNDVLLAAVAGALGNYMEQRGEPAQGVRIRAVVPVNLRPLDAELSLGNQFGLVFLTLPIGIADPVERLREVKRCMDDLKGTPEPAVAYALLNVMGAVPKPIEDIAIDIFGAKGTAVMTNVPGPKEKLYFAGALLDTIMFWVPQSGHLGLGVSILSYAGQVWLGIATDQGLVPDPDAIVAAFHVEFNAVSQVARKKQAKHAQTVRPLVNKIDQSIEKMDRLIKRNGKAKQAAVCRGKTRSGESCKNRPLPGSVFCRVHQKKTAARQSEAQIVAPLSERRTRAERVVQKNVD